MVRTANESTRKRRFLRGIMFTAALGCALQTAWGLSFDPKLDFEAGNVPLGVAIADIDGDGMLDVVVAVHEEDQVAVFRNTSAPGAISLAERVTFPTGPHPQGIAVADIDGDGKPDVATANSGRDGGDSVTVLPNVSSVGAVSLGAPVSAPLFTAHRVRIADLDGDGRPDIAATSNSTRSVGIFENTSSPGSVSFTQRVTIPGAGFLRPLALGDVDADGKTDVVIAVKDVDQAYVFRNTSSPGSFSFTSGVGLPVGDGPEDLFLADLDGDGSIEILTADDLDNRVSILRNTSTAGSVSFEPAIVLDTGMSPSGVVAGDLDGGAGLDVATADGLGDTLTAFRNLSSPGALAFATGQSFSTGSLPTQLAIGDLDADGRNDVVVTNSVSYTISVFRNGTAQGLFIPPFLESLPIGRNLHAVQEARISAVMDHHVPSEGVPPEWQFPYNCATTAPCQTAPIPCADAAGRRQVLAFEGQLGDAEFGENSSPPGFRASCAGEHFLFADFTYAGSFSGGTGTCPGGLTDPASYLDYDGHAGYDFNYPGDSDLGDPILAAAEGWLQIPEEDFVNAPCSGNPQQFNSLRVLHANGLETWYLHAIEGSECIPFTGSSCTGPADPNRPNPGEMVWVAARAQIGSVGATGTGSPHLHFEVRHSSTQQPLDPFGCSAETQQQDLAACTASSLWSLVFIDGFESGDLSAWQTSPP